MTALLAAPPPGMAGYPATAYLYSLAIFLLMAAGCWAVWWLLVRPLVEWWIARRLPTSADPVDAALEANQAVMPTLRPATPGRPLTDDEQAVFDACVADFNRPRPRRRLP